MFWKSKADIAQEALVESLRAENIYLKTQISDLQSQIQTLQAAHSEELKELLDRFSNLVAPSPRIKVSRPTITDITPSWPGFRPDLSPPDREIS